MHVTRDRRVLSLSMVFCSFTIDFFFLSTPVCQLKSFDKSSVRVVFNLPLKEHTLEIRQCRRGSFTLFEHLSPHLLPPPSFPAKFSSIFRAVARDGDGRRTRRRCTAAYMHGRIREAVRSQCLEGGTRSPARSLTRTGHLLPPGTPMFTHTRHRVQIHGYTLGCTYTQYTHISVRFLLVRSTGRNTAAPTFVVVRRIPARPE